MRTVAQATVRILDLGCHDGFVSLWLARRLRERGVHAEVYGLELHPGAVEAAQERFEREGIPAHFRVGLAEQAAEFFAPHSFEVVLCFELIEHVEDVGRLLGAAERMLCPGGRVYVSTPDGTFGTGNNPHHLRTWQASQLVDLIRRRGRLLNAASGHDGLAMVAYTPERRAGEVVIYCGPGWERWAPHDIETKGLGGSETAAVRVADELAALGYVVTVYGDVDRGIHGQVIYEHFSAWDPTRRCDLLISSRLPEVFDAPVRARRTGLWIHDTDCGERLTPARAEKIDVVAVLSRWHHDHVQKAYPWLDPATLMVTRNGIEPGYFDGPPQARARRVLYTSSPDRGLDFLARTWPLVRERVPDAVLAHAYATVYDRVAAQDPRIGRYRDDLARLLAQPGIENLGSLSQRQLAKVMASSRVWAHPSWNGPGEQRFYETFCIGAVEAAAAGCWRVGSNWGALAERELEFPMPELNPEAWADTLARALTIEDRVPGAREQALGLTWKGVAMDFATLVPA